MEPATATIQLELADVRRFSRFVRRSQGTKWRRGILFVIALLLIGGSFFLHRNDSRRETLDEDAGLAEPRPAPSGDLISVIFPGAVFVGFFVFFYWRARRPSAYAAIAPGLFLANTYEVHEAGLYCRNERGETLTYWHVIERFVETDQDFYVMLAARSGYVMPKRCFSTAETAAIFTNQLRMHLEKHAPAALASR